LYTDSGGAALGTFFLIVLIVGLVLGLISSSIWSGKGGSSGAGFAIGFFLGIIGLIIVLLATPSQAAAIGGPRSVTNSMKRECPFCKEGIRGDATVCSHCQRESPAWTWNDDHWWKLDTDGRWVWLDEARRQWKQAGEA
jgi:hypothetical protein